MKLLFRWALRLRGWKLSDKPFPMDKKAVVIFAPHTSNWDFVTMVMAKFAYGIKVRYLGKHTLFAKPFGWLFRALGGLPVARHKNSDIVGQVVQLIEENEQIYLALSPEGTRKYTPYWKTGFYHIAQRAQIPLVMFYLDTKTRTIGFSDLFNISGDIDADMAKFKAYYADKVGYNPEQTSLIQTKQYYLQSRKTRDDNNTDKI